MTNLSRCLRPLSRRLAKTPRGVALVEFAIMLPFILTLLLGIVEFGWHMRNNSILGNAAREGARYGAIGYTQGAVYDRVVLASQGLLTVDGNGDITNGDMDIEQSSVGSAFTLFPTYQSFPVDACPTAFTPAPPSFELLGTNSQPTFLLVKKPAPTPTAAPTFTPAPPPTPIPTYTPIPGATATPTDVAVSPTGATPTPGGGTTGVTCKNTVTPGYIVRVKVYMTHQSLTGFFPFLQGKTISASASMRRE